ncbi:MAG: hypothetical protein ACPGYX_05695, partial [Oceanobacter sp.]
MNKLLGTSLIGLLALAGASGCSDSSSSSGTVTVNLIAGQNDFERADVWSITVTEGGYASNTGNGKLNYSAYDTYDDAKVAITISSEEVHQFNLVGHEASQETDGYATTRTCQWASGCSINGETVGFGESYEQSGAIWSLVAYDLSEGEYLRLTPFTSLAAELAFERLYEEDSQTWLETGYFSAWSVEQSISQLSRLLGVEHIQITQPADLSLIDNWNSNQASSMDAIRYGALMAAWEEMSRNFEASNGRLIDAVSADLVVNNGQLYGAGGDQTLSLAELFQSARDNLAAVPVSNVNTTAYVASVLTAFDEEIVAFTTDQLTSVVPESLDELFSNSDMEDFSLGLQRTKAFVELMSDYEENFFEEGSEEALEDYLSSVKAIGDDHADDFNALLRAYRDTAEFYFDCATSGQCPTPDSSWTWLTSVDSYNSETGLLSLNDGAIQVEQEVADVNTTDSDDSPSQSQGINILITGWYYVGSLSFWVDHEFVNDDEKDGIDTYSGIRVYYDTEVSELVPETESEIIGYEARWSDFRLYDSSDLSTDDELEMEGAFRIFYRGVRNLEDENSELRFNLDTVSYDGRITDTVSTSDDNGDNITNIYVVGASSNPEEFYPDQKFTDFEGFFSPSVSAGYEKGQVETGLVSYQLGTETVSDYAVSYLDIYVPLGTSYRYRAYETVARTDKYDLDNDDDVDELIDTYDLEVCELTQESGNWAVDTCEPKDRVYEALDFDEVLQAIWRSGAISQIDVDGRGRYFVEWPANTADENGCLVMDELADSDSLDGTLYQPLVLGLNGLRTRFEVELDDEPDTLFDMYLNAPTADEYQVTAALSHDYSATTTNTVTVGSNSSDLERIVVNYSTDTDMNVQGSLAIYKNGVSLTLDDDTTSTVANSATLYLNQSTGASPL